MKIEEKIAELESRIKAVEVKINNPSFAASLMGSKTSKKKAATSRENKIKSLAAGKNPGGRPRKK